MHRFFLLVAAALCLQCTNGSSTTTCDGPNDCAPGFTCQNGACVELCIDDQDCEKHESCIEGTCLEVTNPECMADVQCFTPPQCADITGAACWGGVCRYPNIADGTLCNATGGSEQDGLCSSGSCVLRGDFQCATNDVCTGGTCIDGACAELSDMHGPCDMPADGDCGTLLTCVAGTCLSNDGGACDDNGDCVNTCVGPTCAPLGGNTDTCDAGDDADCGLGFVCEGTACAPGTLCADNNNCTATEESCIGGVCKDRGATCDTGDNPDCLDTQQCVGGACLLDDGEDCTQNSACINACIAEVCADFADTGEECDADENADCDTTYQHTCTQIDVDWECRRRDGQACGEDADCVSVHCPVDTCEPSPICVDESTCTGPTPRCRLALPGSGERTCNALAILDEPCDDDDDCSTLLRCDTRLGVPLCKRVNGESCLTDSDCYDNCLCGDNECQADNRVCSAATCETCRYSNDNGSTCNSLLAAGTACDSDSLPSTVEFCSSGGFCVDDVGGPCTQDDDCYLEHCECTNEDCTDPRVCANNDCGECTFTDDDGTSCDGDIVPGIDCDTNKKCDGAGGCWWNALMPCSATEHCWAGNCRTDADDSGQFCASTTSECVYDGGSNRNDELEVAAYNDGTWAPTADCNNPRRPHCETGLWQDRCNTSCGADCTFETINIDEYCHTGNEIWEREYDCNASTCNWNATPTIDGFLEDCDGQGQECYEDFSGYAYCVVCGCSGGKVIFEDCGFDLYAQCSDDECVCGL